MVQIQRFGGELGALAGKIQVLEWLFKDLKITDQRVKRISEHYKDCSYSKCLLFVCVCSFQRDVLLYIFF